ncbi:probable inactive receptor kinase At1g48480 [Elaeis guineensis]|uniref:Probable inactive receptor kinase At1g48480 n=1 Tax=Elaeis guineensis var. tenera TaxID=51953 RepID=A0A6I9QK06_ELAGV|nr:probable inactive receptor kinase At1g48480 [Elaeis guineensis]
MDSPGVLLVFFLLPLLLCFPGGAPDLEADRAALLAFQAAVGRGELLWNASATPCSWVGVRCNGGRVTRIRLPATRLVGQIPAGTLGNLTALQVVSLRLNALSGPLPPDLASCKELRIVYLQGNRFSGEIPAGLFSLDKLVLLNLAINNFTGGISPGFNNLTRLETLHLEHNQLSGEIPDLHLPTLVQFNVSFNPLNGSIPAGLRRMSSDAFLGTGLCGLPLRACSPMHEKSKLSGDAIAGIAIGAVVGFLIVAALLVILCRRGRGSKRTANVEAPRESERALRGSGAVQNENGLAAEKVGLSRYGQSLVFLKPGPKVYDLEDLLGASAAVLGRGTTGTTYKAMLETGMVVAVKRLKDVNLPEEEFREKVEAIGAMDHPNLVPLHAFYRSKDEKLLVYDYIPMGSLSSVLHGNRGAGWTPLDWETRSGIALAAARGIEYIHSIGSEVSHGNIKSSNILLGNSFEAHVSDYSLANLVSPSDTPSHAACYRAPEVTDAQKVSQKADVYSFGVLLLELLTGKPPMQGFHDEGGPDLPRWVQSVVQEEWISEVFDLGLLRYQNVEEEMVQLLQVGIDCAAQYPDKRPSMSQVVIQIEEVHRSSLASMGRNHQQDHHAIGDADDQSSKLTDSIEES